MKIIHHRDDVHVAGALTTETFTIKASAKAFQILSSNLYSNPLGAVIRELSTNAYDAHVMVGKADEPFVLTMPNSLSPSLIIRDFGPGLTEREVMSVYTTFFESTKTDSNDVVGCLGLGSKSPFGISDSFTITSYQKGKRTVYSAFLNDARIPTISKFGEFDTDEEDGLELEVAIKSENFSSIAREVNSQLKYFTVKPIIRGDFTFRWNPEEEYLYQGSNWKMVAERGNNKGGGRVIQGQISYPIDTNAMGKHYTKATSVIRELLARNILFTVNIGDVNIAPSREALTYDDQTCENIINTATQIMNELPAIIKEKIQSAETEYDAKMLFGTIMNELSTGYYSNALMKAVVESGEILWKGKDVSHTTIWIPESEVIRHIAFHRQHNGRFVKNSRTIRTYDDYNSAAKLPNGLPHWGFDAKDLNNLVWVYATENDKAVEARVKQYVFDNKPGNNVYINLIYTTLSHQALADRLGLNLDQVVVAATLQKVRSAARTRTIAGVTVAYITLNQFNTSASRHTSKAAKWEAKTFPTIGDATGYFVELNRFDVMKDGRITTELANYRKIAIELGILENSDPVYGLRKTQMKMQHNLVNFFEALKNGCLAMKPGTKYNWGSSSKLVDKMRGMLQSELKNMQAFIRASSPLQTMITAILADTGSVYSYGACKVIESYGIASSVVDMGTTAEEMDNRYPLVKLFSGYNADLQEMVAYINGIDELHTLRAKCDSCDK